MSRSSQLQASNQRKGSVFIVSAPSGAGKTTLCKELMKVVPGLVHSISYTTRKARPGELDGRDYFFVDKNTFFEMVKEGSFLEWAEVHGNFYGTSKSKLLELVNDGRDVILDIDVGGAKQVMEKEIDATFIFVLPPSLKALKERLISRKTDDIETINRRLEKAKEEIGYYKMYNYVIVNDKFDQALDELKSIVISRRVRIDNINHHWIEETFGLL
jgi:guanylate kinase